MSAMTRPTCGTLYRLFEEHCQVETFLQPAAIPYGDIRLADRAIGHMRGQAEKVYLGACQAFMIRPAQDWWDWALMAMEFTCEQYSLAFYRAKDHGEIWGCRTRSIREHLVEVLRDTTRDGVLWHQQRAMLCGIPREAVDVNYHRREGHGARCEPPMSTATEPPGEEP